MDSLQYKYLRQKYGIMKELYSEVERELAERETQVSSLKRRNLRLKMMIVELQNRLGLAQVDNGHVEEICYDIDSN